MRSVSTKLYIHVNINKDKSKLVNVKHHFIQNIMQQLDKKDQLAQTKDAVSTGQGCYVQQGTNRCHKMHYAIRH